MIPERLSILYVSHMPASPPRFGAQARIHGLMTQLARRHELTAAILVDDEFDADKCRQAMQVWPRIAEADPEALRDHWRLTAAFAPGAGGPRRVDLTGFVSDLRRHLAAAAADMVPLRPGPRHPPQEIVEAMAMKCHCLDQAGRRGDEAIPGRDILVED